MLEICLFEDDQEVHFRPLSLTKPIFLLRTGCFTLFERVEKLFPGFTLRVMCRSYLHGLLTSKSIDIYKRDPDAKANVLFLNARWIPNRGDILNRISGLSADSPLFSLFQRDVMIAALQPPDFNPNAPQDAVNKEYVDSEFLLSGFGDLISDVGGQIQSDLAHLGNSFEKIDAKDFSSASLIESSSIYIKGEIQIEANCVLDASKGPIILDEGVKIKANSVLYGPLVLGPNSTVNAITRISNAVIGPHCKIGGELSSSIVEGYSNKGHDGYLGNSYVSMWCNLGADTNTSNLRNDYGPVKLYSAATGKDESTGLTFLGLIMADHSKCSINTMFNTGTVVGVSCNLFGPGFHDRHIPSFTWGKPGKYLPYRIDKSLGVARTMMARRGKDLEEGEKSILEKIFAERG